MTAQIWEAGKSYQIGWRSYTILDANERAIKVAVEPRPSWAAPCWILRQHLDAIANSARALPECQPEAK